MISTQSVVLFCSTFRRCVWRGWAFERYSICFLFLCWGMNKQLPHAPIPMLPLPGGLKPLCRHEPNQRPPLLFLVNNLTAALSPTGNYTKSKCHHHLSIFWAPGWFMISNLQESKPSSQHPQFASVSQHELKTQVSTRNRWMSSQRLEPPQDIRNGGQQCGKRTALS